MDIKYRYNIYILQIYNFDNSGLLLYIYKYISNFFLFFFKV